MKKITLGILAHVDGGKTTLSEAMLYVTGKIRKIGRVDHKNAYLDNYSLERERGITIFSKQAVMEYKDMEITLLDTPGHVDFSTEMERALQVLDYAVLVVSGSEGVQGHTETLWKLLCRYHVPTFIFVNKMDMDGTNKEFSMANIKHKLTDNIVDFSVTKPDYENIAMCDEDVLETYMESGVVSKDSIRQLVFDRKLFPCYFGSALKLKGVEELLEGLMQYTYTPVYDDKLGVKVYKISKDHDNNRLTHVKITGGTVNVRDTLTGITNGERWSDKVNDIRIYSGEKYKSVQSAQVGTVCAIAGLSHTYSGQGLGIETEAAEPELIPVLAYSIILPKGIHVNQFFTKIKELEEEDPTLQLSWNDETKEITANVMGQVQIQVLKQLIKDRFDVDVEFGTGKILYKETIIDKVEGVGHFEPLRHYAEVHLLLEPGEQGSGITFESNVNESILSRNWQRLIMTHLAEKKHKGVLIGAPVTDIHFTLVAGKAHLKHTEGGDFRQATYRAVRQGLKKAKSVLLEPYYDFVIEVPSDNIGRTMTDVAQMNGNVNSPETNGEMSVITGYAPVSAIGDYINDINEYSHGKGSITLKYKGYAPCHNQDEIIEAYGYDSETDAANPTGSVFCANGSGFVVPWDEVENYMHVKTDTNYNASYSVELDNVINRTTTKYVDSYAGDKELMEIFEKTFGPVKRRQYTEKVVKSYSDSKPYKAKKNNTKLPDCVLVDGYNIIFAWEELKDIASKNIDGARDRLLDILSNYQGYKGYTVIVVFDAYNVENHKETIYKHNNIYVVFTKEAETADMYIAKTTHKMANKYKVTVATSDALEQLIILGHGAIRMSAINFKEEIDRVNQQIKESIRVNDEGLGNYVITEKKML